MLTEILKIDLSSCVLL